MVRTFHLLAASFASTFCYNFQYHLLRFSLDYILTMVFLLLSASSRRIVLFSYYFSLTLGLMKDHVPKVMYCIYFKKIFSLA